MFFIECMTIKMSNISNLLNIYDKVMCLKIYVDGDEELKQKYSEAVKNHNQKINEQLDFIDAGFDLYAPERWYDYEEFGIDYRDSGLLYKVDYKIKCSAVMYTDTNKSYNTGYYLHPRSSLVKTHLRLANSTGIIDSGYRGRIMAIFDVVNRTDTSDNWYYAGTKYDRYVQICAPGLVPIFVEVVDTIEELGEMTQRGTGGFGSTGK